MRDGDRVSTCASAGGADESASVEKGAPPAPAVRADVFRGAADLFRGV